MTFLWKSWLSRYIMVGYSSKYKYNKLKLSLNYSTFRMFPNIMCNVNSNQCFRMPCTNFLLTSIKHSAHLPFYWQKRLEWFYGLMSAIHKWNQCKTFLAEIEIHLRCRNAYISIHPVAIDLKQAEKKFIESVLHIY